MRTNHQQTLRGAPQLTHYRLTQRVTAWLRFAGPHGRITDPRRSICRWWSNKITKSVWHRANCAPHYAHFLLQVGACSCCPTRINRHANVRYNIPRTVCCRFTVICLCMAATGTQLMMRSLPFIATVGENGMAVQYDWDEEEVGYLFAAFGWGCTNPPAEYSYQKQSNLFIKLVHQVSRGSCYT